VRLRCIDRCVELRVTCVSPAAPDSNFGKDLSYCLCHPSSHNVRLNHFYHAASLACCRSEVNNAETMFETSFLSNKRNDHSISNGSPYDILIDLYTMRQYPSIARVHRQIYTRLFNLDPRSVGLHMLDLRCSRHIRNLLLQTWWIYIRRQYWYLDNCTRDIRRLT
jgi:hypothetical protein